MIAVWSLRRGDLFRLSGHILEFERMDGMYAVAWTRTGQMVNVSGHVEVVDDR